MNAKEYDKKMQLRELELVVQNPSNEIEKAINDIEIIICSIKHGSRWFRWGYVKSLRMAIKVLRKINKE